MSQKVHGDEYFFLQKINEGATLSTGTGLTSKEKKLLKLSAFELETLKEKGSLTHKAIQNLGSKSIESLRISYENINTKDSDTGLNERLFWKNAVEYMFKCLENEISDTDTTATSPASFPFWVGVVSQWHRQYGETQQKKYARESFGCLTMIFLTLGTGTGLVYIFYQLFC